MFASLFDLVYYLLDTADMTTGSHLIAMAALCFPHCSRKRGNRVFPLALPRQRRSCNQDDHCFWCFELLPGNDTTVGW